MKNIGIILAGGLGHRMGGNLPKQFLSVNGKTILEHTLSIFQKNSYIDEIFIVTHHQYIPQTQKILEQVPFSKVTHVLSGGTERYHSTLAALQVCPETKCNLIIHDAVRPLLTDQMICECIDALQEFAACTTAIPTTDTILVSDPTHSCINDIPDRNFLYNIQTPQAFHSLTLMQAYTLAVKDPEFHATDDCRVIKKYLPET